MATLAARTSSQLVARGAYCPAQQSCVLRELGEILIWKFWQVAAKYGLRSVPRSSGQWWRTDILKPCQAEAEAIAWARLLSKAEAREDPYQVEFVLDSVLQAGAKTWSWRTSRRGVCRPSYYGLDGRAIYCDMAA